VEVLGALPELHARACEVVGALLECGGVACARLAGPTARVLADALRRGGGGGRAGTCAGTRSALYATAAAATRGLGAAAAGGDLVSAVVPYAALDAVRGFGGRGGGESFERGGSDDAASRSVGQKKTKRRGKGGAWGQAGADEMEAFLASSGGGYALARRGGSLAGGAFGVASCVVRAAALEYLETALTVAGAVRSFHTYFTHRYVSTLDRISNQLTDERFFMERPSVAPSEDAEPVRRRRG